MAEPFTLTVPADAVFRDLAPEVAGKYAELAGTNTTSQGLAAAVRDGLTRVVNGAAPGAMVEITFDPRTDGIHVRLRCGATVVEIAPPVTN
jgi:hypothetical protein